MNVHGPDWPWGLSRWPWASSGTAHSVPLCLAQRTIQSAPRQGVGVGAELWPMDQDKCGWILGWPLMLGTQWILTGICCHLPGFEL